VAVDDMMAELGSAANYKANRGASGSRTAVRRALRQRTEQRGAAHGGGPRVTRTARGGSQ